MSVIIYKSSRKYIRWYLALIRNSENRTIEGYSERHHVFPTSIFGKNTTIVRLTAREHFIAHKLLYKIYSLRYGSSHPKTFKMLKAITYMATREEIKNNSRMYQECKIAYSLSMRGNNNPSVKYGLSIVNKSNAIFIILYLIAFCIMILLEINLKFFSRY